ncbi:MAG TPA: FxDxF family PEP-CTERM protein [Burkholderiaceae bacterium]
MKLHTALTLVALAGGAANASAATVTDWGTLGPVTDVAYVTYHTASPVDDIYTFNLDAASNVAAYAEEFESRSVGLSDATFTLYSGSVGSGTQVGSAFAFSNTATTNTYDNLAAGDYYFEITGTGVKAGSAYDFELAQAEPGGPSDVPEPANAALLVAGFGMLGLVASRRKQR